MADISDVEQEIVNTVTSILYPAGSNQSSIIGALCRVYRGWPNSATLNTDLSAGAVNVTVVTDNDSGRTTTRYLPEWKTTPSRPGLTISTTGRTVTVSGNPAAGDVAGVLIDGAAYAYRIRTGDAPGLIASNLGQLIGTNRPAPVLGCIITVPGAGSITARVVCDNSASSEVRRQEKDFRIIFWCPTPTVRDSISTAIDAAVGKISFLILSDATNARIVYRNTVSYDQAQNALLYRRDLIYSVEYPTITVIQQPSMLFGGSEINGNITYG